MPSSMMSNDGVQQRTGEEAGAEDCMLDGAWTLSHLLERRNRSIPEGSPTPGRERAALRMRASPFQSRTDRRVCDNAR
jgi:hypothetical protein